MRLAVASRIFLPEVGAAPQRLGAAVSTASEKGWDVDVLTAALGGRRRLVGRRVRLLRAPVLRDAAGYVRGYLPYLSFDVPLFLRLLALRRPSIVLAEPPPTTGAIVRVVCGIRRVPYLWYAADVWSDAAESASSSPWIHAAVRALEAFAVRGAAGVVAVSEGVASRVRELGATNVRVVPNGIDTAVYTPSGESPSLKELAELGITRPYVLYAGTASEWQQAERFAEALVRDSDLASAFQMVFVGGGASWTRLKELQQEARETRNPDCVVLVDARSPTEIARLLRGAQAAAVSLAPDVGYDIAYPTKVLAALACGTPVLYAGIGPARVDLNSNGFGLVVPLEEESIQEALRAVRDGAVAWDSGRKEVASRWVREHRSAGATGRAVVQFISDILSHHAEREPAL